MNALPKIALEEHFLYEGACPQSQSGGVDLDLMAAAAGTNRDVFAPLWERLTDIELRLVDMDRAGIDVAVLSHGSPGVQAMLNHFNAVSIARDANDYLAEQIAKHPDRFRGFATLPIQNPAAAAAELERCVTEYDFGGAMVNGFVSVADPDDGEYLDGDRFLEFWQAAAALDVPIYLHPRTPLAAPMYRDHPELLPATWGFGVETATHALRLIFNGVFDKVPNLRMILGHLGEGLPFSLWRINHYFTMNPRGKRLERPFLEYFAENIYFTTSGNFNDQALLCALTTVGADRLLFAVDYPFAEMEHGADWLERAAISEVDRRKIAYQNSAQLLGITL